MFSWDRIILFSENTNSPEAREISQENSLSRGKRNDLFMSTNRAKKVDNKFGDSSDPILNVLWRRNCIRVNIVVVYITAFYLSIQKYLQKVQSNLLVRDKHKWWFCHCIPLLIILKNYFFSEVIYHNWKRHLFCKWWADLKWNQKS